MSVVALRLVVVLCMDRPGGSGDDEAGSDTESHAADIPELLPYGSWELQPRIVVEHIYGWRYPLPPEERAKMRWVTPVLSVLHLFPCVMLCFL